MLWMVKKNYKLTLLVFLQGLQKATLLLAYQSFGVVYGDLCISPVYVYKNTFSGKLRLHEEDEEILGVLSLVFWSLTLIPLLKYIILVLGADDNGEGALVFRTFFFSVRSSFRLNTANFLNLLAMCYICRWDICIVLVNVQALQDWAPEQHT